MICIFKSELLFNFEFSVKSEVRKFLFKKQTVYMLVTLKQTKLLCILQISSQQEEMEPKTGTMNQKPKS